MITKKYFITILFVFFNHGLVNASSIVNLKSCTDSPDKIGCFLNIARIKAFKITDVNQQAEAIGGILKTNAELNRSDFELMTKSFQILRNKKLDLEHYLDLQISIATYFSKRDQKRSDLHIGQAINVFYQAVQRDSPKDKMIRSTWACGLIDENERVWKIVSHVAAEYCTPEMTASMDKNDDNEIENIFITMYSAWVQSDFKKLEISKENLNEKIKNLEEYGIRNNNKAINIATQKLKIILYALQADMYRRSGLQQHSKQALTNAKEALIGLEKLTSIIEALESRLAVASVFNKMFEHEEAVIFLKPITDLSYDEKKLQKIPLKIQVDYLVTLSEALDSGGFKTYNEIKLSNSELRRRQSDVLFEKYILLRHSDDKNEFQSNETLRALNDAAEAGNALAMHNLGVEYAHGSKSMPKDLDKAAYWYSWSATLGFAGAQNNLGDLYENASDAYEEMGLSIYWYTQAAMQGEPTAYFSLGDLFFHGKGVPKNNVTASIWLSLAKRHLPEGLNRNEAAELLNRAYTPLDEKTKKYVHSRVSNFVPLKQTENKLSDKPSFGEVY